MQFKKYIKQRNRTIQGLRSFKDTLPKNIKSVINKRGHIFSETLGNWKSIVGENLFKICHPKSFKNSNRFNVGTLLIMVKRGHEVDLEYSKKKIMDTMNSFFGYSVVEKLKFSSFHEEEKKLSTKKIPESNAKNDNETNNSYKSKINDVKNEKIKKSLLELSKVFKKK